MLGEVITIIAIAILICNIWMSKDDNRHGSPPKALKVKVLVGYKV